MSRLNQERVMLDEVLRPGESVMERTVGSIPRRLGDELIDAAQAVVVARYIHDKDKRGRRLRQTIDRLEELVGHNP